MLDDFTESVTSSRRKEKVRLGVSPAVMSHIDQVQVLEKTNYLS